jgi:hypothetical protein
VGIVQEKNQLEFGPKQDDNGHEWVTDKSARVKKGVPGREGMKGGDWASKAMNNAVAYNGLPPGSDGEDQELTDQRKMRTVTAGTDDVTDNPQGQDFVKGFVDITMLPTDDMYTNEHVDAFYGEGKSDGKVGFLERNNMLDRN